MSELVDIIMLHGWFERLDNPAIELEDIVAKKVLDNPSKMLKAKLYGLDFLSLIKAFRQSH
ncbi:hypothetical protein [Brevibacillus sp. SKDU10]|uniref:hypothetical protein n=1 Tax=Brevibacillus sp. SKDU10 TaxID=1247872 RepID=UPI0012F753F6|nr:hypothetical protein [Brevibacillus sp. SKDU10]